MATCMTLTKLGLLPPQRRRFNFVHSSNFSPLGNCVIFMAFSPYANSLVPTTCFPLLPKWGSRSLSAIFCCPGSWVGGCCQMLVIGLAYLHDRLQLHARRSDLEVRAVVHVAIPAATWMKTPSEPQILDPSSEISVLRTRKLCQQRRDCNMRSSAMIKDVSITVSMLQINSSIFKTDQSTHNLHYNASSISH